MHFTFREVVSEHIIAGPHGALLTVQPSNSLDGGMSLGSTHTLEKLYLRRTTIDGTGSLPDIEILLTVFSSFGNNATNHHYIENGFQIKKLFKTVKKLCGCYGLYQTN